jgi:hypothetical protein
MSRLMGAHARSAAVVGAAHTVSVESLPPGSVWCGLIEHAGRSAMVVRAVEVRAARAR